MWPLMRLVLFALMVSLCTCTPVIRQPPTANQPSLPLQQAPGGLQQAAVVAKGIRGAGRANWRTLCVDCAAQSSPSVAQKCLADCKHCVVQQGDDDDGPRGALCPRGAATAFTFLGWETGFLDGSPAWLSECVGSCDCSDAPRSKVFDAPRCASLKLKPNLRTRRYNLQENRCEVTDCDCSQLPKGYAIKNDCPAGVPVDPTSVSWDPFRRVCFYSSCNCSALAPNSSLIINPCGGVPPRLGSLFYDGEACRYFECNCSSLPPNSTLIRNPCGSVPPDPNSLFFNGFQCEYFGCDCSSLPPNSTLIRNPCDSVPPDPNSVFFNGLQCEYSRCNCSSANTTALCQGFAPVPGAAVVWNGDKCSTECRCPSVPGNITVSGNFTIPSSWIKDAWCDCPGCVEEAGCCVCGTCGLGVSLESGCPAVCNPRDVTICRDCVFRCPA